MQVPDHVRQVALRFWLDPDYAAQIQLAADVAAETHPDLREELELASLLVLAECLELDREAGSC